MKKAFLFVMLSAALAALMGCTNPRDLLDEAMDDVPAPASADVGAGD